jgi:hypothetical protein
MAAAQVARTGNPAQIEAATEVMDQARRSLYRLLAGEEPEGSDA